MRADPQPSFPQLFFDTATAYQRSAAIQAAIELDIFSAIGAGKSEVSAIAAACHASVRGIRILCDYLTIFGFLNKEGTIYRLPPDSALFLERRSPAYLGSAVEFICSPLLKALYNDPTRLVRQGSPTADSQATMAPQHPVWVQYARAMAPMNRMPAQMLAGLVKFDDGAATKRRRVLDIAAGHGLYGITLAQQHPGLEVVASDWPQVLELAHENATAAGVAERWHKLPGSSLEVEFGGGYDLVLLTNFLHLFDLPTCEKLLRKVRAALVPGGRVFTVEEVPNPDRVSPPGAAAFAFCLLALTPGGDAHTFAEFEQVFQRSGFPHTEQHQLPGDMFSVLISQ